MEKMISREAALALLRQYNQEPFHIRHALTVEAVMRWFANDLGYGKEADFWAMCGLLHDIDFEKWPEQHCVKAPELLRPAGVGEEMIHAICSHGHKICTDVAPEKEMEKVLFACDELTGLIGAAALMRPSKSTTDMELSSVKKKFKDKKFAAGCSREVIKDGAELLGWELDTLIQKTLTAMQQSEAGIREELAALLGGDWAVSRPLVEKGWAPNARQIGLSGRTVRPKLIITCGISGAIQFAACMNQSEHIIAINTDPEAPIFNVAHIAMVGDLYQIVPRMIQKLKEERA